MSTKKLTLAALASTALALGASAQAEEGGAEAPAAPAAPQAPAYNMPGYPAMPAMPGYGASRGDIAQRMEERRAEMMKRRSEMRMPSRGGYGARPPMPMDPMGKAMVEQMEEGRPEPIEDSADIREELDARRQQMRSRYQGFMHPAVKAKRDYYRARRQALRNRFYGGAPMGAGHYGPMAPHGAAPYGRPMAPAAPGQGQQQSAAAEGSGEGESGQE